jgi:hypothetical protein
MARRAGLVATLACSDGSAAEDPDVLGHDYEPAFMESGGIIPDWEDGVKGCFVEDPVTTWTAAEFDERIEQFVGWFAQWEEASGIEIEWLSSCPAPALVSGKMDYRGADRKTVFRFLIDTDDKTTGLIPGPDCEVVVEPDSSNFGAFPVEETYYRYCQWNGKLRPGNRNRMLHELGHKLGMAHEDRRPSNPCNKDPYSGVILTRDFDPDSVMGYSGCTNIESDDGLSAGDMLGSEILYPRSFIPKIRGSRCYGLVCRQGNVDMTTDWYVRGASDDVLQNTTWTLGSTSIAGQAATLALTPGTNSLAVQFTDHLGRLHFGMGPITASNSRHTSITSVVLN